MKKLSLCFTLLAAFILSVPAAHADSVTYTFSANNPGVYVADFTYVDPDGFLTFDTGKVVPTTASDLYYFQDYGPLTYFDFFDSQDLGLYANNAVSGVSTHFGIPNVYNLDTLGVQQFGFFTLDIELTNPPAAVTPEPSSLILLGTGAVGILGTARRRYLRR